MSGQAPSRSLAIAIAIAIALVLLLGACKREAEVRQAADQKKLEMLKEENPHLFDPDLEIKETPEIFIAWVRTNKGACWIEVHRDWAPAAVDRFYRLVRSGYYTMMPVYRVVPGRLAQWGIHIRPEINAIWKDRTFDADPIIKSNLAGYAGFAPDPTVDGKLSTQLYINLADNFELDERGYVPFGRVIKGLERMRGLYPGYGEVLQEGNPDGPDMAAAWERGKKYLRKNFPQMDTVKSIVLRKPPEKEGDLEGGEEMDDSGN